MQCLPLPPIYSTNPPNYTKLNLRTCHVQSNFFSVSDIDDPVAQAIAYGLQYWISEHTLK